MARRRGRWGDHLVADSYTGFTCYASEVRRDFWGNYSKKPLIRNLQEIASPLSDPQPVSLYLAPAYQNLPHCGAEVAPTYVGNTTVPTNTDNMAFQVLNLDPSIPDMVVGCTFIVR